MGLEALAHLAHDRLGDQVELLHALAHAPGQGPAVQRDDGVVGATGAGQQRRGRGGAALLHRFRNGGQGGARHAGRGDGAGAEEQMTSGNFHDRRAFNGRPRRHRRRPPRGGGGGGGGGGGAGAGGGGGRP